LEAGTIVEDICTLCTRTVITPSIVVEDVLTVAVRRSLGFSAKMKIKSLP